MSFSVMEPNVNKFGGTGERKISEGEMEAKTTISQEMMSRDNYVGVLIRGHHNCKAHDCITKDLVRSLPSVTGSRNGFLAKEYIIGAKTETSFRNQLGPGQYENSSLIWGLLNGYFAQLRLEYST
ncbi:hypothetical protein ACH5RR_003255 [Cinchona calisaya]|uniref:Uncharacterized protein n=1 Tax=Cinchona calisaya TaxID=153742 RepID=A0ABD3AUA4_9GENT